MQCFSIVCFYGLHAKLEMLSNGRGWHAASFQCMVAVQVLEDVWQSKISLKSSAPAGCTGIQYTGFVNLPQHDVNDYTSDRPSWVSSSFRYECMLGTGC